MPAKIILTDGLKVPIHIWTEDIDDTSIEQLKNVAQLNFVFHHVAAMPDVHAGMGATIGSVIATEGAVIPAAVGVDIGCGMLAVPTNLKREAFDSRDLAQRNYAPCAVRPWPISAKRCLNGSMQVFRSTVGSHQAASSQYFVAHEFGRLASSTRHLR